jgi:hypothetical protein
MKVHQDMLLMYFVDTEFEVLLLLFKHSEQWEAEMTMHLKYFKGIPYCLIVV